mgnify:CR=1 FL=1
MSIKGITTVKSYFQTGDRPTQDQFETLIDSTMRPSLMAIASAVEDREVTGLIKFASDTYVTAAGQAFGLRMLETSNTAQAVSLLSQMIESLTSSVAILNAGALPSTVVGDGVTNDTTAFSTFEATNRGRKIDLGGSSYLVTSIPTGNKYFNGYFRIANYEETLTVDVTMPDTLPRRETLIDSGSNWSFGAQSGGLLVHNGVLHLRYNEGASHDADTQYALTATSYDKGINFRGFGKVLDGDEIDYNVLTTGVVDGQEWVIVRENGSPDVHKLYGRRLYQRRELCDLTISTTNGSPNLIVGFSTSQGFAQGGGVKAGDRVTISDFSASVGGLTLSGTYTVGTVGANITLTHGSNATSSVTDATRTATVVFEQDAFAEKNVGGTNIGAAVKTAASLVADIQVMASPIVGIPNTRGDFYFGFTDPDIAGTKIVKIVDSFTASPLVSSVQHVAGVTSGGETALVRTTAGAFFGAARTNGATANPMRFWYSASDAFSAAVISTVAGFGSNVTPGLALYNGTLHYAMTGTRIQGSAGSVGLYYASCTTNAYISSGVGALNWKWLKSLYHDPHADDGAGSPIGQPEVALTDENTVHIAYTNMYPSVAPGLEEDNSVTESNGQPNIEVITLFLDNRAEAIPTYVVRTQPFQRTYISSETSYTAAGTFTITHNLGKVPLVQLLLVCKSTDLNYAVDDNVILNPAGDTGDSANQGVSTTITASTILIRVGSGGISLPDKTSGVMSTITAADWRIVVKAWI